jgi:hypothetical protein
MKKLLMQKNKKKLKMVIKQMRVKIAIKNKLEDETKFFIRGLN